MKKNILLSALCILSLFSFSQDDYPLIQENKSWNIISVVLTGSLPNDTSFSTITYQFFGDTVIDSQTYQKLYVSYEEDPVNWNFNCFMREENKQVWLKQNIESEDILMYDYNANIGDTIMVGLQAAESVPLSVDSIGTIDINGTSRTIYHLSYYDYNETWIDGIGSSKGICFSGSYTMVGGWTISLCMSDNGELIYQNPNYSSCYMVTGINESDEQIIESFPNPVKETIYINNNQSVDINVISLTNISGQLVKHFNPKQTELNVSDLPTGLYFLTIQYNKGEFIKKIVVE